MHGWGFGYAIFSAVLGAVIGWLGSWVHSLILERNKEKEKQSPFNKILGFNADPVLIIYPPRDYFEKYDVEGERTEREVRSFLPGTSTEDFLAINNMITVLNTLNKPYKIRTWDKLDGLDLGKHNLVLICSPKSNRTSGQFHDYVRDNFSGSYQFSTYEAKVPEANKPESLWGTEARYILRKPDADADVDAPLTLRSESFEEHEDYESAPNSTVVNRVYHDYGIITRSRNIWAKTVDGAPAPSAILISGIRGIGTWGAAECIKKRQLTIASKLDELDHSEGFSLLVRIEYQNADITDHEIGKPYRLSPKTS